MARISSLVEAIKDAVRDGDTVALEGFTHLIPHAAGHETGWKVAFAQREAA